jgi:hypothetical protein
MARPEEEMVREERVVKEVPGEEAEVVTYMLVISGVRPIMEG